MATLQRPAHSPPARPGAGRKEVSRNRPCIRVSPVSQILPAGLAVALISGFAQADSVTPASTDGTYRSSEQPTHSPAELGLSLSVAPLPDPAMVLQQAAPGLKTESSYSPWTDDTAWITGIGTWLYNDLDRDGYHSSFSLSIDADTSMNSMDVYVSVDLQSFSGVRERLHTSSNFSLYGRTLTDEYQIDIDLLQSYSPDEYDLFVELHDTYDHRVLDRVSAVDFSNLSALPLESEDLDYVYDSRPARTSYPAANDDIYVEDFAGSAGLLTMFSLVLSLWVRRRKAAG